MKVYRYEVPEFRLGKEVFRSDIERAMASQQYTAAGTAPRAVLRFLAAPTDVNWGGRVHGGKVMRWIDEATYVCASGWAQGPTTAVYVGGFRFYQPLRIGDLVEVEARLLQTGRTSMHVSVHVRSGDPRCKQRALTTHGLLVYVALSGDGKESVPVRAWTPASNEDEDLEPVPGASRCLISSHDPAACATPPDRTHGDGVW